MNNDPFAADSKYEVPSSSDKYMKFQSGENKFRIMSSPITGWEIWVDTEDGGRKPVRHSMDKPFTQDEIDDPALIKHFWAMVVWNYKDEKVQILEVTQKSIQKTLRALSKDPDWGTPVQTYDLVVTKTGEKLETEYEVLPKPSKKMDEGIVKLYEDMNIKLEALYEGKDPFNSDLDKLVEDTFKAAG